MTSLVLDLHQAVRHHQAGELAAAENLYRKILRADPRHPDALHLLGVAAHQQHRHGEAVQHIEQAVAIHGSCALFHCNLGAAYRALGKHNQAVASFREALRIDPAIVGAHYNLGMALQDLGRHDDAAASYRAALRYDPKHAEAHNNLGRMLASQGEFHAAAVAFRNAIAARPGFSQTHYNLGNSLAAMSDFEGAVNAYKTAASFSPDVPEIHNNLGTALKELGRIEEATRCFREALILRPDYTEAHNNLGSALQYQGDLDTAEKCFRAAISLCPDFVGALTNLGNVCNERGDLRKAFDFFDQALRHDPFSAEAHFNRALAWLRAGDFARGWTEYEWRWKRKVAPRGFTEPQWDGSPLNGRAILLYAEQGVGDEIQFASCIPDVLEQHGEFLLECDPRLVPLFARSFPRARVFGRPIPRDAQNAAVVPAVDLQIALGCLPGLLRPTLESFPNSPRFLVPDQTRVETWRQRFGRLGPELKVGIAWRGGKEPDLRRRRSTSLGQWDRVFSIPSVRFVSLQYGDCFDEMAKHHETSDVALHDWPDSDKWNDLDGLAAEIAALDLVISVDNSTVHLAGALGVPVWTLLPFVSDWRWLLNRDRSPWYPRMRLFRQPRPGDWASVFNRVGEALLDLREETMRLNSQAIPPDTGATHDSSV